MKDSRMAHASVLVLTSSQKWLLPSSLSPRRVPVVFYLSRRPFNISNWVWPGILQMTSSALELRACETFCVHPLRVESLSYGLPALPYSSPAGLPSLTFWVYLFSWWRTLRLESPVCGWDLSLFGENLFNCGYPPSLDVWSWLYCVSVPPIHLTVALQLLKIFSARALGLYHW